MNKFMRFFGIPLAVLIALAACTLQEPELQQTTASKNDSLYFSRFMALGDNIIAGYQNAALTEKHQHYGFVAQIARQGGAVNFPDSKTEAGYVNFQQPLIGYPGIGALSYAGFGTIELYYLDNPNTPNTVNPDPLIKAIAYDDYPDYDPATMPFISEDVMTYPLPYSNLGIPGIVMEDILKGKTQLKSKSHSGMIPVILRNPLPEPYGELTAYQQAKLFQPSILLCWVGMYDVLGYAQYTAGDQPGLDEPTPADEFAEKFGAMADSLLTLRSNLIIGNIPDITDFPYFNTVPAVVIDTVTNAPYLDNSGNMVPLIGVNSGDKITTSAKGAMSQGYGIPADVLHGNGEPIPDDMILDVSEIEISRQAVEAYNTIIDSVCANRKIPVVNMHAFYQQLKTGIYVAGMEINDDFISGGFYSLDGIHPSDLGNGLIANEWLEVINAKVPVSVPLVNLNNLISELQGR